MSIEFNKLRTTAIAWLGRQEYYESKFRQKLKDKEADEEQIELIVTEFIDNSWLSEQRYCDAFVRSRIAKGQGKMRIKADAQQKRLDQDCLHQALESNEPDWFAVAQQTYNRRYGDKPMGDAKEKAKRMRFMQYRGFNMDQTLFAMAPTDDEE
jgi:regulatory protein